MDRIGQFFKGFFLDHDNKPSSKRITAIALMALIYIMVIGILVILYRSVFKNVELKPGQVQVIQTLCGVALMTISATLLAIFGVQGWQQIGSLKFGEKKDG